jgi:hypothetical protein
MFNDDPELATGNSQLLTPGAGLSTFLIPYGESLH